TRNHHRRGEIDVGSSSTVWSVRNSAACKIEIHVLATRLPLGVEELNRPTRVGLIHVKKAAEMHSAQMDSRNTQDRILKRLELEGRAGLNPVRVLAVLIKPHNGRRLEEPAGRQGAVRTERCRRSIGIGCVRPKQRAES